MSCPADTPRGHIVDCRAAQPEQLKLTLTDDSAMAAAAMIGESSSPNVG